MTLERLCTLQVYRTGHQTTNPGQTTSILFFLISSSKGVSMAQSAAGLSYTSILC